MPLSSQISLETQEQYNAMQVGVFQLLVARQQEIQAGRQYIDALLAYWLSRSDYEALLQGLLRAVHLHPRYQGQEVFPFPHQPIFIELLL